MHARVIGGFHAVEEHLSAGVAADGLLVASGNKRAKALAAQARRLGVPVLRVSREELQREAGAQTRDVALVLAASGETPGGRESRAGGSRESRGQGRSEGRAPSLGEILQAVSDKVDALLLLLDGVTDPQNLGAILRSAEQFGVDAVVLPKRRTAGLDSRVVRAAAGATAHLKVVQGENLVDAIAELQRHGFWVFGADSEGLPAPQVNLSGKIAVVMGSEGEGLRRLVRERCDGVISIPTRGKLDSLNVSVATGILLYEIRRRSEPEHSGG